MDDIDEHLFMLIRLKGSDNREIGLVVTPVLSSSSPNGLVKKNFKSLFNLLSVI